MKTYERIDFLRKGKGITLAHLNDKIGGYRGKLTEVKNGKTTLSDDEIRILARELSTSVDYLLGATDDPAPIGEQKNPAPGRDGMSEDLLELLDSVRDMSDAELALVREKIQKIKEAR